MAILPEGFQWSEFERQDNALWRGVRTSLVNFIAFDRHASPYQLGSGFVVGVMEGGYLLVLTAKHVLMAAIRIQEAAQNAAHRVTPFLFTESLPDIHPERLVVLWMGNDNGDIFSIKYANFSNDLDVAVCLLQCGGELRDTLGSLVHAVALDLRVPVVGEEIYIVALAGQEASRLSDEGPARGMYQFSNRPIIRVGRILSIEERSMGHKAVAFRTSVPIPGGMSGGFAYSPIEGGTIGACGIVSHSDRDDEFVTNFEVSGQSTIVGILGVLALQIPLHLTDDGPTRLLAELVHSGEIQEISGLAQQLSWSVNELDGSISVGIPEHT